MADQKPQICLGGLGDTQQTDDDLLAVLAKVDVDAVKAKIAEKWNGDLSGNLQPIAYRRQVVAGSVYIVNFKLADGEHIHASFFSDLHGEVHFQGLSELKGEHDQISHF